MARVAGELIINHIEKAITEIYDEQTRLLSREKQQEELAKEMQMLQQMKNEEDIMRKEVENDYLKLNNLPKK